MSTAKTVLVADDSLTIRKLVETVLSEEGYQVTSATSGSECLTQAVAQKPNLILLDYILPDMQGTEVCRSLINSPETWEIPVLMMSSNGNAIRQLYQELNNVADYLTKPFAPSVLKAVVGHLLQKEKPVQTDESAAASPAPGAEPAMPKDFMDKVTRLLDLMENQPLPADTTPGAKVTSSTGEATIAPNATSAPRPKTRRPRKKAIASAPAPNSVLRKFRLALQKHLRARMPSIPEWESGRGTQDPEEFFLSRLLAKDVLYDLSADLVRASGTPPDAAGALRCPVALVPLDSMLQYLHTSRATGELRIDTGEETVLACVDQGEVVLLTSNHPRNYCAGAACDFQAVPHTVISEAVRAQEEQSLPFFMSLESSGHLPTHSSLEGLLRSQGENCLLRAFKASQSVASFFPLVKLSPLARKCKLDFSLNRLLLACYRTVDDWFTLEKVVPDLAATLVPTPELESLVRDLPLNSDESQVLAAIRPGRTIPELAEVLQRKPFEICLVLFRLIKLGLVRPGPRRVHDARVDEELPVPAPAEPFTAANTEPAPARETPPAEVDQNRMAGLSATSGEPVLPAELDPPTAGSANEAAPVPNPTPSQDTTATLDGAEGESANPQTLTPSLVASGPSN